MKNLFLSFLGLLLLSTTAWGQLSNAQLMKIKEDADDGKSLWIKLFEESRIKNEPSNLTPLRKENESFLRSNISQLSRMYAEGDGRELITAIKNYLVIEQQFVRNVMIPAETLSPTDNEGYEQLNKKISEFTQKERAFEIDIHNALRSSPEPLIENDAPDEEANEPETEITSEPQKEAKPKRKRKLPHEEYEESKSKKRKKSSEDEE